MPGRYFIPGVYVVNALLLPYKVFGPTFLFGGLLLSLLCIFRRHNRQSKIIRRLSVISFAFLLPTLAFIPTGDARYIYPIIPVMYALSAIGIYNLLVQVRKIATLISK